MVYKEPWMQEHGLNKFCTIVSEVSSFVGNHEHAHAISIFTMLTFNLREMLDLFILVIPCRVRSLCMIYEMNKIKPIILIFARWSSWLDPQIHNIKVQSWNFFIVFFIYVLLLSLFSHFSHIPPSSTPHCTKLYPPPLY